MKDKLNSKLRILELREFFIKYSEEEHQLGINEIIEEFSLYILDKYGVECRITDETLMDDIKTLNDSGFEIIVNSNKYGKKTYSYQDRLFDNHEIGLIMNAVGGFKFLGDSDTVNIKKKLLSVVPKSMELKLDSYVRVNKKLKVKNCRVKYNLCDINMAIEGKKIIRFSYNEYYIKDGRIYTRVKHGGRVYEVLPYGIVLASNKCYLVARDLKENRIKHFRVELIDRIEITDNELNADCEFNLDEHMDRSFNMHSSEALDKVRLRINRKIINNIVDYFGQDVIINEIDENFFEIEKELYINQGLVSWIIQYGENIEVIGSETLKELVKEKVKRIYDIYSK